VGIGLFVPGKPLVELALIYFLFQRGTAKKSALSASCNSVSTGIFDFISYRLSSADGRKLIFSSQMVWKSQRTGNTGILESPGLTKPNWTCVVGQNLCGTPRKILILEVGCEAQRKASGRPDGVAGEQTAEVDYVKDVGEVLTVDLKPHT